VRINVKKFIIIGIAIADKKFIEKNKNINLSIENYNNIYKDIASQHKITEFMQPFNENTNLSNILIDEFHVNVYGNEMIVDRIIDQIKL
jgi:hypothetical protein